MSFPQDFASLFFTLFCGIDQSCREYDHSSVGFQMHGIDLNNQKELCELAGVSASTIGKMGRGEPVSVEMVERVCLALECTPNDVLEFYRDNKKQ